MRRLTPSYGLVLLSLLTGSAFGGFWGVAVDDSQADAVPPPSVPLSSVKLKPGVFQQKITLGIANLNTEAFRGNNGVLGYTVGRALTDSIGVNLGLGVYQGYFRETYSTSSWESKGWYFPAQINLQYQIPTKVVDLSLFGGPSYTYGSSTDTIEIYSINYKDTYSTFTNIYGAQAGVSASKAFGSFELAGMMMLQTFQGRIRLSGSDLDVRNSNFLHIFLDLIYTPLDVGLTLTHQRDFNGKGNVTTLQVGYNF
jgi:hypothetical protein